MDGMCFGYSDVVVVGDMVGWEGCEVQKCLAGLEASSHLVALEISGVVSCP